MTESEVEVEPEADASGSNSFDAAPPKAPSGTRGAGNSGGGRRERGTAAGPNLFTRLGQLVRDVRAELRRVSWPSAKEVKNTTIITLVAVVFFAGYLFVVDQGFG